MGNAVAGRLRRQHGEIVTGVESNDGSAVVEQSLEYPGDFARDLCCRAAFGAGLLCGYAVHLAGFERNLHTGICQPLVLCDELPVSIHNCDGSGDDPR
ncbi:hypothetical protein D3C73_1419510 [compost metagenome]